MEQKSYFVSRDIKMFFISVLIMLLNTATKGNICRPVIADARKDKYGYRQIECEVSTCADVTRVQFEKTGIYQSQQWTQVFEGINKTHYTALDTGTEYSLKNRNDYTAFRTKHLLYIKPLLHKDKGLWRCVVYDANNMTTKSESMELYNATPEVIQTVTNQTWIITPKVKQTNTRRSTFSVNAETATALSKVHNLDTRQSVFQSNSDTTTVTVRLAYPSIIPNDPLLVVGQLKDFSCIVNGIHIRPEIVWEVNGKAQAGSGTAANRQRDDGLWFVMNTIRLAFGEAGINVVSCVVKTKATHSWLQKHVRLDVKEPASVFFPQTELNVTFNSTFTLHCVGEGYKPNITWRKDGKDIINGDERYIIKKTCNASLCIGSMTSSPIQSSTGCVYPDEYPGVYTCLIALDRTYQSTDVSPSMNVKVQGQMCIEPYDIKTIAGIAAVGLCAVVVLTTVGFVICMWKKKNQDKVACNEYAEVSDVMSTPITPIQSIIPLSTSSNVEQGYDEIKDLFNPKSSIQGEILELDSYSHCSLSDKASEHSYDACYTDMGSQMGTYIHPGRDNVVYKRMDSQGRATYVTKDDMGDVVYKRMDCRGRATYVTKDDMDLNQHSFSSTSEYMVMENQGNLTYMNRDAIALNQKTRHGSPIYINKDVGKSKRRLCSKFIDKPD